MQSRGFIKLSTIITAALAVGFIASGFLNFSQHQQAQQDRKLLQGEITDLRYQINQDKIALGGASPSPTASPLATPEPGVSPSPTPTPTPAVLEASTPKTMTVKKASIQPNLRALPNSSSAPLIAHVPAGTPVTLVDEADHNGYRHVTINGQTGYILASYLN